MLFCESCLTIQDKYRNAKWEKKTGKTIIWKVRKCW